MPVLLLTSFPQLYLWNTYNFYSFLQDVCRSKYARIFEEKIKKPNCLTIPFLNFLDLMLSSHMRNKISSLWYLIVVFWSSLYGIKYSDTFIKNQSPLLHCWFFFEWNFSSLFSAVFCYFTPSNSSQMNFIGAISKT